MADPLPSGRFSGREAFLQLVRDALACAAHEGWREIIMSDASFEDWPLRERSVVESLQAWSTSGRHMVLLASSYEEVIRLHPRFVSWRQTWGHILDCRLARTVARTDFPSAIWSQQWFMYRVDPQHSTGVCGTERERLIALKESLDETIRNSSPGFAASTLGL